MDNTLYSLTSFPKMDQRAGEREIITIIPCASSLLGWWRLHFLPQSICWETLSHSSSYGYAFSIFWQPSVQLGSCFISLSFLGYYMEEIICLPEKVAGRINWINIRHLFIFRMFPVLSTSHEITLSNPHDIPLFWWSCGLSTFWISCAFFFLLKLSLKASMLLASSGCRVSNVASSVWPRQDSSSGSKVHFLYKTHHIQRSFLFSCLFTLLK